MLVREANKRTVNSQTHEEDEAVFSVAISIIGI